MNFVSAIGVARKIGLSANCLFASCPIKRTVNIRAWL